MFYKLHSLAVITHKRITVQIVNIFLKKHAQYKSHNNSQNVLHDLVPVKIQTNTDKNMDRGTISSDLSECQCVILFSWKILSDSFTFKQKQGSEYNTNE